MLTRASFYTALVGTVVAPGISDEQLDAAGIEGGGLGEGMDTIELSHHQKDSFHIDQTLSIAFGTSNTWAPLFLATVAAVLLVIDPDVYQNVWDYLTGLQRSDGLTEAAARAAGKKQIHGFLRKNPRYAKKGPLTPLKTYAVLKQVESTFADCLCSKKGPLFTAKGMREWKKLMKLILDVHYGAAPDTPRYIQTGTCANSGLATFKCNGGSNTSWIEHYHEGQKESAAHGVGMVYADMMLHSYVDRCNTRAGIEYCDEPSFGACGVTVFDDEVVQQLY